MRNWGDEPPEPYRQRYHIVLIIVVVIAILLFFFFDEISAFVNSLFN